MQRSKCRNQNGGISPRQDDFLSFEFCVLVSCLSSAIVGSLIVLGPTFCTAAENLPALMINEFMASNSDSTADPQGQYDDWIEIYNCGRGAVNVGGMYLTDDLSYPTKWRMPDNNPSEAVIPAQGYLIIWADNDTADVGLHASFNLNANGEEIALFDSDGVTLIDSIAFGRQTTDISYGRYPDGSEHLRAFVSPSPAATNVGVSEGLVSAVEFSHERGFYDAAFSVTLATETEGAVIYYTLDGSEPFSSPGRSPTGKAYVGPVYISGTACLRARAVKPGWKLTDINTHTYIFPTDVIAQSQQKALSAGYPNSWNGYGADYEMDRQVCNDPDYADLMEDALLSIPTLSVTTDKDNLFGPSEGIYVNTTKTGDQWERPASAEFFSLDDSRQFQINCGLRLQGGASRQPYKCPKHSLSLRFRGKWGPAKLEFPLFKGSPVKRFDSLHLRGMFNNSWIHWNPGQRQRAQMIRDQWVRDSLLDMGEPSAGRGIFVHLYLNGMYWGVYNLHERPEASNYAAYYGGNSDELDALNGGSVRDGNYDAWNHMKGTVTRRDWDSIQQVLAVDNYIDWTIIQRFGSNNDLRDNGNWRAAGGGPNHNPWRFYAWDAERVLEGVTEGAPGGTADPPGLLNYLDDIEEFRVRFGDRLHKHLFNGGALTPEMTARRWTQRADELSLAIIAESARWGDYRRDIHSCNSGPYYLYTKNDFWLTEQGRLLNQYLPYRTANVLNQYKAIGLYPTVDAPAFRINGIHQHGGPIPSNSLFSMTDTSGTTWYTLDGSDPPVGTQPEQDDSADGVSPGALKYGRPFVLMESTIVKARALSGRAWSALNEATFAVGPVVENLRVTEIMYHAQDPNEEFIELRNVGAETINLNLVSFSDGIDFTFPSHELAPNEHVVVVSNRSSFEARYGNAVSIAGQYAGKLNNAGERIMLQDAIGRTILDFAYEGGWRSIADGKGFSLTVIDPTNPDRDSWRRKDSWRASAYAGGSPGKDDSGIVPEPGAVVINELLAHSHDTAADWIELYSTTVSAIDIGGWFLSDSDDDPFKFEIGQGTIIGPGEYMVFYEALHFGNPDNPGCRRPFSLSENGGRACLSSAQNGIQTGYAGVQDFGASETGVSFGRYYKRSTDNYHFIALDRTTQGAANADPKVGPIVISEIMYHPAWPSGGHYTNEQYEYVELHNISDRAVTLYDYQRAESWKFTDGIELTFDADAPVTIPAAGRLLVVKNPTAFSWRYPSIPTEEVIGPYDGNLSNSGEKLELSRPGDLDAWGERRYIHVDKVNYSDGSHPEDAPGSVDLWPVEPDGSGLSLTRIAPVDYGNDPQNWIAAEPSPSR